MIDLTSPKKTNNVIDLLSPSTKKQKVASINTICTNFHEYNIEDLYNALVEIVGQNDTNTIKRDLIDGFRESESINTSINKYIIKKHTIKRDLIDGLRESESINTSFPTDLLAALINKINNKKIKTFFILQLLCPQREFSLHSGSTTTLPDEDYCPTRDTMKFILDKIQQFDTEGTTEHFICNVRKGCEKKENGRNCKQCTAAEAIKMVKLHCLISTVLHAVGVNVVFVNVGGRSINRIGMMLKQF